MKVKYLIALSFIVFEISLIGRGYASIAKENEKLVYKTNYMWLFPTGTAEISFEPYEVEKNDVYKVSAIYKSPDWLSLFFKITGEVNSFIDAQTYLPVRYEEFLAYTGVRDQKNILIYDQNKGKVYIDRNGEKEVKSIPHPTLDPLSAVFYLRNQSWEKGQTKIYNLNNHQSNYHFKVKCVNIEKFKNENTWVLEGSLKRSDLIELPPKATFTVWISQKDERLPVKMKLKTKLGYIFLTLKDRS